MNSYDEIMNLKQDSFNVKSIRTRAGLTQQEVAALAGIDPANVIQAEFDIKQMSNDEWQKLLQICHDRIDLFVKDNK